MSCNVTVHLYKMKGKLQLGRHPSQQTTKDVFVDHWYVDWIENCLFTCNFHQCPFSWDKFILTSLVTTLFHAISLSSMIGQWKDIWSGIVLISFVDMACSFSLAMLESNGYCSLSGMPPSTYPIIFTKSYLGFIMYLKRALFYESFLIFIRLE